MTATVLTHPAATAPPAAALADRRPPLTRLTALEIRKILSTRSGRTLAVIASLLPAAAVAAVFASTDVPQSAEGVLAPLGALVAVLLVAVGVLSTAGEWTHGTVQTTFLAVPRRGRVVAAKYAGVGLLGAAISAVVVGTSLAVAGLWPGVEFAWTGAGTASLALVGAGAALAVTGAGIGAAVGNAPAALTGTYATLLVIIPVLQGIRPALGDRIDPITGAAELIGGEGGVLRPILILAGWVLVATVAGGMVTRRRPVA